MCVVCHQRTATRPDVRLPKVRPMPILICDDCHDDMLKRNLKNIDKKGETEK